MPNYLVASVRPLKRKNKDGSDAFDDWHRVIRAKDIHAAHARVMAKLKPNEEVYMLIEEGYHLRCFD